MNNQRLNLGLYTKLSQKLLITPQMRQSLSLLQMPLTELSQEISSYLDENPLLELIDQNSDYDLADENLTESDSLPEKIIESTSLMEDLSTPEWDDYINDSSSNELVYSHLTPEEEGQSFENYVSSTQTLSEFLLYQLHTAGLEDIEIDIGEQIIGNLDEDGYFTGSIADVASACEVSLDAAQDVLSIIKQFAPAGIASENLIECILSQLNDVGASDGEVEQIRELLTNYSHEFITYQYDKIIKKSGLDAENINDLLSFVRKTDPKPGASFTNRSINYILPDVYIVPDINGFEVILNEVGLPPMRLNNYYLKQLRDETVDSKTKEYLEDKVKNAVWILKSLQKRQKAIYRVSKAIVDIQSDYLLNGESHLKPLRLKDIADITELHESTVSRVTSGKYASTPQGMIELKSFFSKGMEAIDGEDMSTRKIKTLIKEVLDNEPTGSPYSDEKIVKMLEELGVDVARRTVAKYRDEMGVPTMSQRKKMRRTL